MFLVFILLFLANAFIAIANVDNPIGLVNAFIAGLMFSYAMDIDFE
jgi:hypothetical protein